MMAYVLLPLYAIGMYSLSYSLIVSKLTQLIQLADSADSAIMSILSQVPCTLPCMQTTYCNAAAHAHLRKQ